MFEQALDQALSNSPISRDEFSELIIRLLDYGIISRDESQIENLLYDRFVQCENLVEDYLSIMKVKLQHDRRFRFVRAFPPGASVPGMPDDDHSAFNAGFRAKPTQQDIAVILTLRVEYEKALREGQVNEDGSIMLSLESLAISHKNLLKRNLPESSGEKKIIFRRLKQLRLIQFNQDTDLDSPESWISIHPSITSFVSDEVLDQLYPQDELQQDELQREAGDVL